MSGVIYPYRYATTLSAPPGSGQVRADQGFGPLVTTIWLHNKTDDNVDVHVVLMKLASGSELTFQDKTNHANACTFTAAGAPIDRDTYVEVPVTFVQTQGQAFSGNQQIVALLYAAPIDPPGVGPGLLPLAMAKQHLRITDSLHDADVQVKLTQAEATVLEYLAEEADPAWTLETLPTPVVAAILMYTTHLYEHRGDDMSPSVSGATPDVAVWDAIRRLLARRRTQAIGVGLVESTP